jgi:hypothetical protein
MKHRSPVMAATLLLAVWGVMLALGGGEAGSSTPVLTGAFPVDSAAVVAPRPSVSRAPTPCVGTSTTAWSGMGGYLVVTRAVCDCREYAADSANWGCCRTNTYDLGRQMRIATISGQTMARPSEQTGMRYDWAVLVSSDGTKWTDLGTIPAYGARVMPFGPVAANCKARYVQICSGTQGYVDYSDLVIVLY